MSEISPTFSLSASAHVVRCQRTSSQLIVAPQHVGRHPLTLPVGLVIVQITPLVVVKLILLVAAVLIIPPDALGSLSGWLSAVASLVVPNLATVVALRRIIAFGLSSAVGFSIALSLVVRVAALSFSLRFAFYLSFAFPLPLWTG